MSGPLLFVDTGAFIGKYVERDQHRAEALAAWQRVVHERPPLATSNFVLDEMLTNVGRMAGFPVAVGAARSLFFEPGLRILRPDAQAELAALELFEKFADQKVSFTDCISFVLMRAHRIRRAFTFDRHFATAGFQVWP